MPEHIHLLVNASGENSKIEKLLYAIKRFSSSRVKWLLQQAHDPLFQKLFVQERPGKIVFRFWQEGPGHDRNIMAVENCIAAAEYIHNNPVRRGLCATVDQWRWSSWRHYHVSNASPTSAARSVDLLILKNLR
jgi:REP element-mobilizing transposase RayT